MSTADPLLVVSVHELEGTVLPANCTHRGKTWWASTNSGPFENELGRSYIDESWLRDFPLLLVTDVDSTLIEEEVIDRLAELAGSGRRVAELTELAMQGEMDFADSLTKRVKTLAGLPTEAFTEVYRSLTVRPGADSLFRWIHKRGGQVAAVSGGFTPILELLAADLNIDHIEAIDLEVSAGKLTGSVAGPVVTAESKRNFLERLTAQTGYRSVVLGDGANDLLMLETGDLGIGINAKPIVRELVPSFLNGTRLDPIIGLLGHSEPFATSG